MCAAVSWEEAKDLQFRADLLSNMSADNLKDATELHGSSSNRLMPLLAHVSPCNSYALDINSMLAVSLTAANIMQ